MKVFLDDIRATPDGWTHTFWPEEAIELLKTGQVTHLSLDHDLGDDEHGTGYDVLTWIEEQVFVHDWTPPGYIQIHSDNSSGVQRMLAAIESIRRRAPQVVFHRGPHPGNLGLLPGMS